MNYKCPAKMTWQTFRLRQNPISLHQSTTFFWRSIQSLLTKLPNHNSPIYLNQTQMDFHMRYHILVSSNGFFRIMKTTSTNYLLYKCIMHTTVDFENTVPVIMVAYHSLLFCKHHSLLFCKHFCRYIGANQ